MLNKSKLSCAIILLFCSGIIHSQNDDGPFKKLYDNHGLIVSFIFYSDGDCMENNGVVIYLENKNAYDISFQFMLIFRALSVDREKHISGTLKAKERRTGSSERLYFLPFDDGKSLSEVGIKGCRVEKFLNKKASI